MAATDSKNEKGEWKTINGVHVFIREGESTTDAINRVIAKQNEEEKNKQIAKHKEIADTLNGKETKEQKLARLEKELEDAKGLMAKAKIHTQIEMVKADWQGTKEEWQAHKDAEHQKAVEASRAKQRAEEEAKKAKEDAKKKQLEEELKTQPKDKIEQYKIIQQHNPMMDDYHVGIRKPSDIKTWKEIVDAHDDEDFAWGDFSRDDAEKALKAGKITIYSSYPIKQGVFVSTSYSQAEQYAGGEGKKVYSKVVPLSDIAWISGDEGQFAKLK